MATQAVLWCRTQSSTNGPQYHLIKGINSCSHMRRLPKDTVPQGRTWAPFFYCFAVCHDWSLEAPVQHTFNQHKVQRQSACVRMPDLLSRHRVVVVALLLNFCGFLIYLGFSREEKGYANQATVVVVVIIPWEGREKSTGGIQVRPQILN